MSRTLYPFYSSDISALARSLKQQWAAESAAPGHLQILNMLARSTGFANYQHWLAACTAPAPVAAAIPPAASRLLRHFDAAGRLLRWPKKFSEQRLCLWAVWAALPAAGEVSEPVINDSIRHCEAFGDHVLLRRELVEGGWLGRTPDCRVYWRIEQAVPAEAAVLIEQVSLRRLAVAA